MEFKEFKEEFYQLYNKYKINWEVYGFLSRDDKIYAIGSDTKVLSTVFELLCAPLIREIASKYGYQIEESPQTIYPDFTLLKSRDSKNKIAIDIKTTYRRGVDKSFVYTLGSYTSFLRNNTKNILYPYDTYKHHWVIGFLYSRRDNTNQSFVIPFDERGKIVSSYGEVEFFIQEKYKIVGERPASGNTTNIGSSPAKSVKELAEGKGPFAKLGKETCDEYWRNFDKNAKKRKYTLVEEYIKWQTKKDRKE
jgi:hypothetical protein